MKNRVFKSIGSFDCSKGKVIQVINQEEMRKDNCPLVGKHVVIDGKTYLVKGVDYWCVPRIAKGDYMGLMV